MQREYTITMATLQYQLSCTIKSQSKSKDASGICFYKQAGFSPQTVPCDPDLPATLEEAGSDYFNTYLHPNDEAFFLDEHNPKIDSTLPDLSEFGILDTPPVMERSSPLSQDNDPFLSSFASAMLNPSGDNETYRDLGPYLPSLNSCLPVSSSPASVVPSHQHSAIPTSLPTTLPHPASTLPSESSSFLSFPDAQDLLSPPPAPSTSFEEPPAKRARVDEDPEQPQEGGQKYVVMRKKNNMASRRSRMTKKEKEKQMEDQASVLEQENDGLRIRIRCLETITQRLQSQLLSSVRKNR